MADPNAISDSAPGACPVRARTTREIVLDPAAFVALAGSLLFVLAVLLDWSSRGNLSQMEVPVGGNTLQLGSSDGMFMIGVFGGSVQESALFWYRRTTQPNVGGMLARYTADPIAFDITRNGWGFGIQYWMIILGAASAPLWWWFVQRDRHERRRQLREGLCRGCGYDLRMSPIHCPECGRYVGRITVEPG